MLGGREAGANKTVIKSVKVFYGGNTYAQVISPEENS
jgi:hypothetical protein